MVQLFIQQVTIHPKIGFNETYYMYNDIYDTAEMVSQRFSHSHVFKMSPTNFHILGNCWSSYAIHIWTGTSSGI